MKMTPSSVRIDGEISENNRTGKKCNGKFHTIRKKIKSSYWFKKKTAKPVLVEEKSKKVQKKDRAGKKH